MMALAGVLWMYKCRASSAASLQPRVRVVDSRVVGFGVQSQKRKDAVKGQVRFVAVYEPAPCGFFYRVSLVHPSSKSALAFS